MMKKVLSWLLLFCLLLPGTSLAQEGEILFDEVFHVYPYGCVSTKDGRTVVAMSMREKENRTEGENPSIARLVCLGADGKVLWEHREGKNEIHIYGDPALMPDGTLLVSYHHYKGTELNEWELQKFSMEGEKLAALSLTQVLGEGSYLVERFLLSDGFGLTAKLYDEQGESVEDTKRLLCVMDENLQVRWQKEYNQQHIPRLMCSLPSGYAVLEQDITNEEWKNTIVWMDELGNATAEYPLGIEDKKSGLIQDEYTGQLLYYTIGWDEDGEAATDVELLRFNEKAELLERLKLEVPETNDRAVRACELVIGENELLLLCTAKTDTCIRLMRFDLQGKLISVADTGVENDVYLTPELAQLGDRLYACVPVERAGKESTVLLPFE